MAEHAAMPYRAGEQPRCTCGWKPKDLPSPDGWYRAQKRYQRVAAHVRMSNRAARARGE